MGDSTRQATRSVFASRANSVARPHRERMRVLFIDQYSELGGAQQCLLDLLPAVRESGWEAHAAWPGEGPLVERLSSMGAAVRPIPCGPLSSGHKSWKDTWRFTSHAPSLASAIRDLATNLRADLLYVNGPRVLPCGRLGCQEGAAGFIPLPQSPAGEVGSLAGRAGDSICPRHGRWLLLFCCSALAAIRSERRNLFGL